eukprot:scaffold1620_cov233-Pinguiococcus_pyrenoidosus.AAC.15
MASSLSSTSISSTISSCSSAHIFCVGEGALAPISASCVAFVSAQRGILLQGLPRVAKIPHPVTLATQVGLQQARLGKMRLEARIPEHLAEGPISVTKQGVPARRGREGPALAKSSCEAFRQRWHVHVGAVGMLPVFGRELA